LFYNHVFHQSRPKHHVTELTDVLEACCLVLLRKTIRLLFGSAFQNQVCSTIATLVRVFVVSRVDYCLGLLGGVPMKITNKLQRVLNAAARVVSTAASIRPWTHPRHGDMFYTGSTSLTGSDSDCASRCSNVSTAWLLDTWPSSADLSPASMDTGLYDLLAVTSLMFHELNCQPTEDALSVRLETLFLCVSRRMHRLCLTLRTSSNICTSRPTSTLSTFEFFLHLTRYKFPTYLLAFCDQLLSINENNTNMMC